MFFLYPNPSCYKQKILNCLANTIVFVAKFFGIIWIQKYEDRYYSNQSLFPMLWSFIIKIIIIISCVYICNIYNQISINIHSNQHLFINIVGNFSITCFFVLIGVCLITVTIYKKTIVKAFNMGSKLSGLYMTSKDQNHLLNKLWIKLGFEILMFVIIMSNPIEDALKNKNMTSILFSFVLASTLVVYFFVGTIYYVSLAYALFILERTFVYLKTYQKILDFIFKTHNVMQLPILFFVIQAFTEFFTQVCNFLIQYSA